MPECKKTAAPDHILWDIATELLHNRNRVKFQAPGVSMSPIIRHHDMITVKPCTHRDVAFGDIILYHGFGKQDPQLSIPLQDKKIVHRFLWRRVGDNNRLCDPPVLSHQVLGKVVEIEKNGWRLRLDSPLGRLLNRLCALAIIPPVSFFSFPCMKKVKWVFHKIRNEPKPPNDHVRSCPQKSEVRIMTIEEKIPIKSPETAHQIIDGEAVIITPGQMMVHVLNSVGSRIWDLANGERNIQDIVKIITEEFDISYETAFKDAVEFTGDLAEKEIMGFGGEGEEKE
jgi:hypothetical protein